jgi:hypothetical protein
MGKIEESRLAKLRACEKVVAEGIEQFAKVGRALRQIRDDELFKEDGFQTWEAYCKARWEWTAERARQLIVAAEYRDRLPEPPKTSDNPTNCWKEGSVRELTRLEKQDAVRVASKVVRAVEQSAKEAAGNPDVKQLKLTAATVRKFVDEDLGIDRAAKAKETKRQREEQSYPELHCFLNDMTGQIEAQVEKLKTVIDNTDAWDMLEENYPGVMQRFYAAQEALVDFWVTYFGRRAEKRRKKDGEGEPAPPAPTPEADDAQAQHPPAPEPANWTVWPVGSVVTETVLKKQFNHYAVALLGNRLEWVAPTKERERTKWKVVQELPLTPADYNALVEQEFTTTVGALVEDAFCQIEELGYEMREVYDNMPENLKGGWVGTQRQEVADALENLACGKPEVPGGAEGIKVIFYPAADLGSRPKRASNAADMLRAAADEARSYVEKGGEDAGLKELADSLERVAEEVEFIDFPGMYG